MSESTRAPRASTDAGTPLQPGDPPVLGRYQVLRRLGEGGMGTVYLARDLNGGVAPDQARSTTERLVAIKVIKAQFAHDPEFTQRFHREAHAASQVPAFCTARVLDAGPTPTVPSWSPSSSPVRHSRPPSTPTGRSHHRISKGGMAAALSAIPSADIVHRDLKPSNVLLSPAGPRVIDFGVARPREAAKTHSNLLIGTPAFMAPEGFTGTGIGPTTDIFAWGGVLAHASSGERTDQPGRRPNATATKVLRCLDREAAIPDWRQGSRSDRRVEWDGGAKGPLAVVVPALVPTCLVRSTTPSIWPTERAAGSRSPLDEAILIHVSWRPNRLPPA